MKNPNYLVRNIDDLRTNPQCPRYLRFKSKKHRPQKKKGSK